jgi:hypothetical protein
VVYRALYPSTDAVVVASANRAALFYLLHDDRAPTNCRWRLGVSPVLTASLADAAIELRDDTGRMRLRIHAPGATDASRRRLPVTTRFEAGEAHFALAVPEGEPVAYPVLVDPILEVHEWAGHPNDNWDWDGTSWRHRPLWGP